jgi:hypothetical protein
MSAKDSSNTHEVISDALPRDEHQARRSRERRRAPLGRGFPYVNGGLVSGSTEVPRFSKIARSYLLHIGTLDWKKINPDIFGSMIQAVADDEERGALGMHYTSVPNILKVLNPLFLDDLAREAGRGGRQSAQASQSAQPHGEGFACSTPHAAQATSLSSPTRKCGRSKPRSTNAAMRKTVAQTSRSRTFAASSCATFRRRLRASRSSSPSISATCSIAGQKEALAEFLPLTHKTGSRVATRSRLDWLSICPPTGTGVKLHGDDPFNYAAGSSADSISRTRAGETYICGNPPYLRSQSADRCDTDKSDSRIGSLLIARTIRVGNHLDYVAGLVHEGRVKCTVRRQAPSCAAFVSTNSICQGVQQVAMRSGQYAFSVLVISRSISLGRHSSGSKLWPANNAGVTVAIVGLSNNHEASVPTNILFRR